MLSTNIYNTRAIHKLHHVAHVPPSPIPLHPLSLFSPQAGHSAGNVAFAFAAHGDAVAADRPQRAGQQDAAVDPEEAAGADQGPKTSPKGGALNGISLGGIPNRNITLQMT